MSVTYSRAIYDHSARPPVQREWEHGTRHSGPSTTDTDNKPTYAQRLVSDTRMRGRGNGSVHIQLMRDMQQTHGNRAVQLFIQRAASSSAPPVQQDIGARIQAKAGSGSGLDSGTRGKLEANMGADLSGVKVHTDGDADDMSRSVDAVAFTTGNDIFFRQGAYEPQSQEGMRLLAHEATHTVQQSRGPVSGTPTKGGVSVSDPSDSFEQEASHTADAVVQGEEESGGARAPMQKGGAEAQGGGAAVQRRAATDLRTGAQQAARNARENKPKGQDEGSNKAPSLDAQEDIAELIKELPPQLRRIGEVTADALKGTEAASFAVEALHGLASGGLPTFIQWIWDRTKEKAEWVGPLVARIFGVLKGQDLIEFVALLMQYAEPLNGAEKSAGQRVLGSNAVPWDEIRIAEGGVVEAIARAREEQSFQINPIINMAEDERSQVSDVVHELVHVAQSERVGVPYIGAPQHAAQKSGHIYGGMEGLKADGDTQKHFRDFSQEQQAEIAHDFYMLLQRGGVTTVFEPFIEELQQGAI